MPLTLRPGTPDDAVACGTICYHAFTTIAAQHNFPSNYPSPEVAIARTVERLAHPGIYAVVAELDGRVVGSNFLDERSPIAGLGPITVDPAVQDRAIGRHLMQAVLDRAEARQGLGVRLVHASYHTRALSLYAKMGFVVRDPVARMTGPPLAYQLTGYAVRPATLADLDACDQLCQRVHGHHRHGELLDAIQQGTATVVEHAGHVSGYATTVSPTGHAVGESNAALQALIGAAGTFERGGFLVPLRNGELFAWCLAAGFRVAMPQTLMSRGFYQEPTGAFCPSVLY
ncbi:MAG: GNAT family N-acetyltransferase [Candidatus Tectomicrobia bacterium]|uniref:GNAT family N-acetyltransferase n=1 Tax=Tectimicrobiota bacterium TaxID=2528274 RepID=A0A937W390_UNCTE|nr:GNAT family N-acetyltransferase [Candidatus Tectomicrobia bacterium]